MQFNLRRPFLLGGILSGVRGAGADWHAVVKHRMARLQVVQLQVVQLHVVQLQVSYALRTNKKRCTPVRMCTVTRLSQQRIK